MTTQFENRNQETGSLNKPLPLEANYKVKEAKQPHFLLVGMGDRIDDVAAKFTDALAAANVQGLRIGRAAEVAEVAGQIRSVRAIQDDRLVHHSSTDLILRRQADDLYVKFEVKSRTWLRWLKFAFYGTIAAVFWCVLYGIFFTATNTRQSIVQSYAKQWADSSASNLREAALSGFVYDESSGRFVSKTPISLVEIFRRDPKLFLTQLAGPPAILAGMIGLLLKFSPRSFFRSVCRAVGWPTAEEFENMVTGHAAWTEGVVSLCLLRNFGVDERMKITVQ